jgi:lipoprotein
LIEASIKKKAWDFSQGLLCILLLYLLSITSGCRSSLRSAVFVLSPDLNYLGCFWPFLIVYQELGLL